MANPQSETKVGYSFGNYLVPDGKWGEAITPDDLRFTYLWGVDLKAADVMASEISDEQLRWCVNEALAAWEQELKLDIRKRVYKVNPSEALKRSLLWDRNSDYTDLEDMYDFKVTEWQNFGFLNLRHRPIISVETAELFDRLGNRILDVKSWLRIYYKVGQLQIYPKGAYVAGGGGVPQKLFYAGWPGMFDASYPQGFKVEYTTGFPTSDFIPQDLRGAIATYAAYIALAWVGDGLMAGFSSSSIGLDGLSEAFSSTQSATSAYFGARIEDYRKRLKEFREHNKYRYGNVPIGFIGR